MTAARRAKLDGFADDSQSAQCMSHESVLDVPPSLM